MPSPGLPGLDTELLEAFRRSRQEGVFCHWAALSEEQRASLVRQAAQIDLPLLDRLIGESGGPPRAVPDLAPFPAIDLGDPRREAAARAGRSLLSRGAVGFVTVAGGQATRLGIGPPKGTREVGPVSGKSLFRWHAEKVLAASRKYGHAMPWVVMTSDATAAETEAFFANERWFGLEGRVRFVRQRMLPAVDSEGRILLGEPGRIAMSPNGHGGVIDALGRGGALEWFAALGIELISYFQVDNALINPADPPFLGFAEILGAEMSAKVVTKSDPLEKAGIVAVLNGRPGVLEYSELPEALARATDPAGRLLYRHANIAAHVFSRTFLERMQGYPLPHHCARRTVRCVDEAGHASDVLARKFEMFVFDAVPEARGFFAFETTREEEFAPLKNAAGENSPATVHAAILERTRRWYAAAGRAVPTCTERLELSPLAAYDLETFREYLARAGGEDLA